MEQQKMSRSEAGRLGALTSSLLSKAAREKRIEEYNLNPKRCKGCDVAIDYDRKRNNFCSKSCAAKINNLGVCRNPRVERVEKTGIKARKTRLTNCLYCGKELTVYGQFKFCSQKCNQDKRWEMQKTELERAGGTTLVRAAKKYLRDVRGEKCEICGITEWMGQIVPLVMDHIDGNAENNLFTNLRLVCGNCDMQLPTYKSKNKGNGRLWRKEQSQKTKDKIGEWI